LLDIDTPAVRRSIHEIEPESAPRDVRAATPRRKACSGVCNADEQHFALTAGGQRDDWLTRLFGMHNGVGDELANEQADHVTPLQVELERCKPLGDEGTSPRGSIDAGRQVRAQRRSELG
jgi:hypothetical protein